MSTYFKLGVMIKGAATTATAGGTTALSATSRPVQQFTGTQAQTVTLPDATTLKVGRRFDISNRSTQAIVVNNFGGTLIATIPADSQRYFLVTDIGSSNGVWQVAGVLSSGGGAGVTNADRLNLLGALAGSNLDSDTIASRSIKTNPEESNGNFWISKSGLPLGRMLTANFALNGFLYAVGGQGTGGASTNTNYRFNQDYNYFLSKAVLPANIQQANGIADSTAGYIVGGFITGGTNGVSTHYKYVDTTDTWSTLASLNSIKYSAGTWVGNAANYIGPGSNNGSSIATTEAYDATNNVWRIRLTISPDSAYSSQESAYYNGYGYTFGGDAGSSTALATGRKYNENLNSYSSIGNLLTARRYPGCGVSGGFLIVFGGEQGSVEISSVEKYLDQTNTYVSVTSLSSARDYVAGGNKALNQSVYAIGGGPTSLSSYFTSVDEYKSFSWIGLGTLKRSSSVPTSILVSALVNNLVNNLPVQIRTDGMNWKQLVAGTDSVLKTGESLSVKFQPYSQVYSFGGRASTFAGLFSDVANAWYSRQAIPAAVTNAAVFSISGLTYLAGGTGAYAIASNYAYSEITNSYATKTAPAANYDSSGAFQLNGFGYIVAGINGASPHDNVAKYDPTLNTWASVANYGISAYGVATAAQGGYGFGFAGSTTNNYPGGQQASYKYSDTANTWTSIGNLGNSVSVAMAIAIASNIYICGGFSTGAVSQSTTYKYDVIANSFASMAAMGTAVQNASANACEDFGFISGGYLTGGSFTAANQRYNPYANIWESRTNTTNVDDSQNTSTSNTGSSYRYEIKLGIPAYYAGLGESVWVTKTSMPTAKTSGGSFTFESYVYASDGNDGSSQVNLSKYDTIRDFWISETNFPYANQESPSSNLAVNGFAHRFGDGAAATNQLHYRYEPISRVWKNSTAYPTLIYQQSAACLNGLTYGFCGNRPGVGLVTTNYSYSDTTDSWTSRAAALNTSQDVTGSAFNGFIYQTGSGLHNQYNDAADSWLAKTASGLTGNSYSVIITQGRLVASGGNPVSSSSTSYIDSLNVWSTKQSMPASRVGQYNGTVGDTGYVTGGTDGAINRAETFSYVPSVKNAVLGLALEIK